MRLRTSFVQRNQRACAASVGCALVAALGSASSAAPANAPPGFITPSRWFPIVDSNEPRLVEQDADGSLRLVERGLRLVEHADGRLERADVILPTDGALSVQALPERLAGGMLFTVSAEAGTRLYRATTWTGPLTPLVRLPFETSAVVPGFDRLYAVSTGTRAAVGIDAKTGALIGKGSLPDAAAYGGMAFSDGWVGAVEVDVRGVLVTFDAGASFHALRTPTTTPAVYEQGGRVVIGTPRGGYAVEASGELERVEGAAAGAVFSDLSRGLDGLTVEQDDTPSDVPIVPHGPSLLGARPLEVAVLRGYPDTRATAVVIGNGTLARVGLEDGRVLASAPRAVPPGDTCVAVRLFAGIGFVCGAERGPTHVFTLGPNLSLAETLEFTEPRTVAPSGTGALTVHGGCPGGSGAKADVYCAVSAAGVAREVRVEGDVGAERVAAFADGRVAVLVPPRFRANGSITVVPPPGKGKPETHALSLDKIPTSIRELVRNGLLEDGVFEIDDKTLGGWVVGQGPFVGVRIALDGTVTAGTVRADAPRASFSGLIALVTDAHGGGFETTNGGATWSELSIPVATDVNDAPSERERGCSPVGCGLGSWLRVGFGKVPAKNDLALAADPPRPPPGPPSFVTWSLKCSPTGETETPEDVHRATGKTAPHHAAAPQSGGRVASRTELESSAWRTFLGALGPERAPSDLGFDFGTEDSEVQLRGYAWGARGASWDRTGSWLVRVANRFSVRHAVWSTAVSRAAWADATSAAEAFGSDPSHRVDNSWSAVLDPVDPGGVLFVRTGSTTESFVVEQGRAVVALHASDDLAIDRPAGAVKVNGKWYLGTGRGARALQVLSIEGGTPSLLASFPRSSEDSFARVVRTVKGDALGIWVTAHGRDGARAGGDTWLVHPLDPVTNEALEPLVISRESLAHAPRPCEPDENGWVLTQEVEASIARVELENATETPSLAHVEARLVAGPRGLCLDALAARVEGDPPKNIRPTASVSAHARRGAILSVTDRATDRRWGFRCAP